ncbi:MAG: YraN family protein [Patescibacteria group bacterium]
MAKHNEVGALGEKVAGEFFERKGFKVISRNYRKPYGEIDLVIEKSNKICFVEVKTVSWETGKDREFGVSHETHRPEDNVHPMKIKRLLRVIEAYLVSHEIDSEWQFDIVAVYLDQKTKIAKVRHLENIILGS